MPACNILDLAKAMSKAITNREDYPKKEVGIRPGEKIHEVLVSEEEMLRAIETDDHYIICPPGELERPILMRQLSEYASNNTHMLGIDEITALLRGSGWV